MPHVSRCVFVQGFSLVPTAVTLHYSRMNLSYGITSIVNTGSVSIYMYNSNAPYVSRPIGVLFALTIDGPNA